MVIPVAKASVVGQSLFTIWEKSDSAYRSNPTTFLKMCNDKDYEGFLEVTNITDSLMSVFEEQIEKQADVALLALGTEWLDDECTSCLNGGLPAFGRDVADLRQVLDTLAKLNVPDTVPNFDSYIDSCVVACSYNIDVEGFSLKMCVLHCNLLRALRNGWWLYNAYITDPGSLFE